MYPFITNHLQRIPKICMNVLQADARHVTRVVVQQRGSCGQVAPHFGGVMEKKGILSDNCGNRSFGGPRCCAVAKLFEREGEGRRASILFSLSESLYGMFQHFILFVNAVPETHYCTR